MPGGVQSGHVTYDHLLRVTSARLTPTQVKPVRGESRAVLVCVQPEPSNPSSRSLLLIMGTVGRSTRA